MDTNGSANGYEGMEIRHRQPTGTRLWRTSSKPITFEVGRDASCDYVVADDDSVSRHHARVTLLPSSALIEDLGSGNGTWVNGQRLTEVVEVPIGSAVGFRWGSAVRGAIC